MNTFALKSTTMLLAIVALTMTASAHSTDEPQCCQTCESPRNKYYSIANDSGPWLCGETCIRNFFYPIFHIFEKNLTKSTWTNSPCADAGYTKYQQTVTHGGAGLYCTLDLYACDEEGGCPHPGSERNATKLRGHENKKSMSQEMQVCKYSEGVCGKGELTCETRESGQCYGVPNSYRTSSERYTCNADGSWTLQSSPYNADCGSVLYTETGSNAICKNGHVVKCA